MKDLTYYGNTITVLRGFKEKYYLVAQGKSW